MSTLYHGSDKLFRAFRVKGKRPTAIKAKGRKVVYLAASRETAKRKYAKGPKGFGYLYTLHVSEAVPYGEAIAKEGLHAKKTSLTEGIFLTIPQYIRIVEIVKVYSDGREELVFSRPSE